MSAATSLVARARSLDPNSARAFAAARWILPLLFGVWSVARGVDANWDLLNYHLYNPFALLHGKLDVDLAPAGAQTYFNPLIDVPYFLLNRHLAAPLVGFVMGAVHGSSFVLIAEIARAALPRLADEDRYRVPLFLAIAGCLTPSFLAALGNTMGDNATALLVLGSLLIILKSWLRLLESTARAAWVAAVAGAVAGLAVGLKLTNGPYAVALCVAFVALPAAWRTRIALAAWFGAGVLLGVATTGGYWFVEMWHRFQNPLFPQFTSTFPNALAGGASMLDARWGPKSFTEGLLWPFVFSLEPERAGPLFVRQLLWPIVYIVFCAWLVAAVVDSRHGAVQSIDPRSRFLVTFAAAGYLIWMLMFGIYRYLVSIELIAPLVVFVLLGAMLAYDAARRIGVATMTLATVVVLAGGYEPWEHRGWADPAFRADVPRLAEPDRTTALIATETYPTAWLATQFPPSVAFVHLAPFPTGPAYRERALDIIAGRGGPVFALLRGHWDERRHRVMEQHALLTQLGITRSATGCRMLASLIASAHTSSKIVRWLDEAAPAQSSDRPLCELALAAAHVRDIEADNRRERDMSEPLLARYGFALVSDRCASHAARIGDGVEMYQWCEVAERRPTTDPVPPRL